MLSINYVSKFSSVLTIREFGSHTATPLESARSISLSAGRAAFRASLGSHEFAEFDTKIAFDPARWYLAIALLT